MKVNDEHESNQAGLASGIDKAGEDQIDYGQKISDIGSAVSGKAVAAKDFVASKLGYGETTQETNNNSSSPLEYGRKIALTVTEKLKPGEEDKALSEVISEAFNKSKDEVVKVGESAFKRQQPPPKGEVTESEELTRRLGKEDKEATEKSSVASAAASTGRSVVDMVKDTVGSWLGKGGDPSASSQQSLGTSQGKGNFNPPIGLFFINLVLIYEAFFLLSMFIILWEIEKGVEGFVDSSQVEEERQRRDNVGTKAEVRVLQDMAN